MLALAWLLPADEYGQFVFFWSFALVFASVASLGGPLYLLKEMALSQGANGLDRSDAIKLVVLLPACITSAALLLIAIWPHGLLAEISPTIDRSVKADLAVAIVLGMLLNYSACMCSILHGFGFLNSSLFVRDALPQSAALIVSVSISYWNQPTASLILPAAGTIMLAICALETFFILRRNRRTTLLRRGGRKGSYTVHYWTGSLLGVLWAQIDILFGALVLTSEQLGIYNILRRICNLITLPMTVATWLTVGPFSRAFRDSDVEMLGRLIRKSLLVSILPGILLAAIVIVSSHPVQRFYALPDNSNLTWVWSILIGQALLTLIFSPVLTMAATSGHEKSIVIARILGVSIFAIFLFIFSITSSELSHNATALVAGTILIYGYTWWVMFREFGLDGSLLALAKKR